MIQLTLYRIANSNVELARYRSWFTGRVEIAGDAGRVVLMGQTIRSVAELVAALEKDTEVSYYSVHKLGG